MMEKNILCCTLLGGGPLSLNTEGVVRSRDEMVGCGGFIRDLRGSRSCGFAKRIGYANSFLAKLWGVYERLFTRVKGYQLIEVSMLILKLL